MTQMERLACRLLLKEKLCAPAADRVPAARLEIIDGAMDHPAEVSLASRGFLATTSNSE